LPLQVTSKRFRKQDRQFRAELRGTKAKNRGLTNNPAQSIGYRQYL